MADVLFTLPLPASTTYVFSDKSSIVGGSIINDKTSAGNIIMTGTGALSIAINGAPAAVIPSQSITIGAGEYLILSSVTPLNFTLQTEAGTTGKMIVTS